MPKRTDAPSSTAEHRGRNNSLRGSHASAVQRARSAQTRGRNISKAIPTPWSKSDEFAIQLLLDPHVTFLEFRPTLSYSGREVPIEMFVAGLDDGGRVAFDVIDERPYRDLDAEGLLLLALKSHSVRLIEIDHAAIDAEPRASNTRWLWSYREHQVPAELWETIDRALAARQRLTIRSLTSIVGLRDPMKTIGALVSQGVLAVDPSKRLGPNSDVRRRSDRWPSAGRLNWFGKIKQ